MQDKLKHSRDIFHRLRKTNIRTELKSTNEEQNQKSLQSSNKQEENTIAEKILFKLAKKNRCLQISLKRNTFQRMPYFKKIYKWKKTVFLVGKTDF